MYQPDVCVKDGDMLEQHFDAYSDGARCPTCGEIYYDNGGETSDD